MAAKILLVEDEPYNRQMVSGWLRNREYEVTEDGVAEFLQKPFERESPLTKVERLLPGNTVAH